MDVWVKKKQRLSERDESRGFCTRDEMTADKSRKDDD